MIKTITEYAKGLLYLFYPELCIACNINNREINDTFCLDCYSKLPFTNQQSILDNKFIQHFTGKIKIQHGAALFYFVKQGLVQNIIQDIKYKNKPHYAEKMGELLGNSIKLNSQFDQIDIIVPVPLHSKKEKERGYNQSLFFAKGISKVLDIPVSHNNLIRNKYTSPQTKMNREERLLNLNNAFLVNDLNEFKNKHILLVDDVLTTGATLLECGLKLLECKNCNLSLATIAMGESLK